MGSSEAQTSCFPLYGVLESSSCPGGPDSSQADCESPGDINMGDLKKPPRDTGGDSITPAMLRMSSEPPDQIVRKEAKGSAQPQKCLAVPEA